MTDDIHEALSKIQSGEIIEILHKDVKEKFTLKTNERKLKTRKRNEGENPE